MKSSSVHHYHPAHRFIYWLELLQINNPIQNFENCNGNITPIISTHSNELIIKDIRRTRSNEELFQNRNVLYCMKYMLEKFCFRNRIEYTQGINEILAPIMIVSSKLVKFLSENQKDEDNHGNPTTISKEELREKSPLNFDNDTVNEVYALFERMMHVLAPTIFAAKDMNSLKFQFTALNMLITYHNPLLSHYLKSQGMYPDIYAASWFITLFSRKTSIPLTLYLWDILLQINKPYFLIFIALALILKNEDLFLNNGEEFLPQKIVGIAFTSEAEIDNIYLEARSLEDATPKSFLLMICRVGFSSIISSSDRALLINEMKIQPCVMIESDEVSTCLTKLPSKSRTNIAHNSSSSSLTSKLPSDRSSHLSNNIPQPFHKPYTNRNPSPNELSQTNHTPQHSKQYQTSTEMDQNQSESHHSAFESSSVGSTSKKSNFQKLNPLNFSDHKNYYIVLDCCRQKNEEIHIHPGYQAIIEGSIVISNKIQYEIFQLAAARRIQQLQIQLNNNKPSYISLSPRQKPSCISAFVSNNRLNAINRYRSDYIYQGLVERIGEDWMSILSDEAYTLLIFLWKSFIQKFYFPNKINSIKAHLLDTDVTKDDKVLMVVHHQPIDTITVDVSNKTNHTVTGEAVSFTVPTERSKSVKSSESKGVDGTTCHLVIVDDESADEPLEDTPSPDQHHDLSSKGLLNTASSFNWINIKKSIGLTTNTKSLEKKELTLKLFDLFDPGYEHNVKHQHFDTQHQNFQHFEKALHDMNEDKMNAHIFVEALRSLGFPRLSMIKNHEYCKDVKHFNENEIWESPYHQLKKDRHFETLHPITTNSRMQVSTQSFSDQFSQSHKIDILNSIAVWERLLSASHTSDPSQPIDGFQSLLISLRNHGALLECQPHESHIQFIIPIDLPPSIVKRTIHFFFDGVVTTGNVTNLDVLYKLMFIHGKRNKFIFEQCLVDHWLSDLNIIECTE